MPLSVTEGIEISVTARFEEHESNVRLEKYVYSYEVTITNTNNFPVRLTKRKWRIFDASGSISLVQGDGVIGLIPVIKPGEYHQYSSWSQVKSPLGTMSGSYLMEKEGGDSFWVEIPEFDLVFMGKLN